MNNSMDNMMKPALPSADVGAVPSWLIWAVIVLAVLAAVFFIGLPLYRKFKRKQLKVKETSEIRKDLMIWHHLAQLVRGGSAHQKAKQMLSDQIVRINILFKQGLNLLQMHSRKLYEQPWFIIVGEPMSGKSSLLRGSELELVVSAEEENNGDEKKSLPLRLWLGAKAVICDVNGRVFFDRWLNGSSAEWNYIGRLLRRKRYKKPLDGLIITLPADALLADDEALTQQKAILMTTEIGQLLHTIGMYLPCYVVVTKADMVNGFNEYVMGINDDLRSQIFGWINGNSEARYDAGEFREFWDGLIARLHAGCEKSMLSRNVATKLSALSNRMEITGKIYLFPDNFDKLYQNLSIYLRALFGEGNFHGADNAVLEGVFFTSAKDGEVTLSPSFAKLCGRSVEEAPIPREPKANARPYFIRDLLHKVVFRSSPNAFFTYAEQIRRNIPKYLLCLFMLATGTVWLSAAYFKAPRLKDSLAAATDYYASLTPLLQGNGVFNSPLIKKTGDGKYVLNNDPLEGSTSSRMQFFFEVFSERESLNIAPFGFKTASLLVFGDEPGMGYDDKAFILNQLYGILVRTPVIKSVGEKLIAQGEMSVLNDNKRDVIDSFSLLNSVEDEDFTSLFTSGQFRLKPMISYLIPGISGDTMSLLDSFLPKYDRKHTMTMDSAYIHSEAFFNAQKTGLNSILAAWNRLDAYPQATYSKIRSAVRLSRQLEETHETLNALTKTLGRISTVEQLNDTVRRWNDLVRQQAQLAGQMEKTVREIQATFPLEPEEEGSAGKKTAGRRGFLDSGISIDVLLRYALKEYEGRFRDDFNFVRRHAALFTQEEMPQNTVRKYLKESERNVSKKLSAEASLVRESIGDLRDNPLYQWQFFEKPDISGYTFRILQKLYEKTAELGIPDAEEIQNGDFKTNWVKTQRNIKDALAAYDAAVKPYAGNEEIAAAAEDIRKMLLMQADLNRFIILDAELRKLPSTETEMYNFIAANAGDRSVFDISEQLAREAMGDLQYNKGYDPAMTKQLLEDLFRIAAPFMKDRKFGPQEILPPTFMEEYRRYDEELGVFEKYLDSYLRYWGTYPDNVYVPAASWEEFKRRLDTMKAFKVNSLLRIVYAQCLNILKGIDDTLLSGDLKKEKADYTALISDRLNMLTPLFTDAGTKTLNAWAELPAEPEKAWDKLSSLSEQELQNTFFNVYTTAPRSRIAWWNDFVDNGVGLLRHENEKKLEDGFQKTLREMSAFPLCRNCGGSRTVTPKQMEKLARLLQTVTPPAAEAEKAERPLLDRKLALFKNREALDWASDILKVADSLTDTGKPLIWTLYQAPIELQNALLKGGEVAAINRFRYIEVKMPGAGKPRRFSTAMTSETMIGQGKASSPITLNFYKLSGDETPEAQVKFSDYWAIFRIYLKYGGHYDPATDQTYVPITIRDRGGAKFTYFVTVKFNRDIFKPDEWPTKRNWLSAENPTAGE